MQLKVIKCISNKNNNSNLKKTPKTYTKETTIGTILFPEHYYHNIFT